MPTPATWLLDELAHAGEEHLDAAFVTGYDRKQKFDPEPDIAELRARKIGLDATLIDLAAGTGKFALAAARAFGHVIAVDVSPAMVAHLGAQSAASGLGNLDVVQAGFLTYEHSGTPVDAVYTRNALHQLPDFWKGIALARMAALLRPGGLLLVRDLIYDFQPREGEEVFAAWLAGAVADPAEGYTREDFAPHIRSEHSTYRWLLEPLLAATGFEIVSARFSRRVYGAYTCLRL